MTNHMEHPFFEAVKIEQLNSENFEQRLVESSDKLVGVFFWGHNCPNCEIAKARLAEEAATLNALGLKWFHVNTYENFDLGTKFGLFGIPTFLFFYQGKKLGRISPFPGLDPFFLALNELKQKCGI
ncbi:MAG: thioredoxin family protein [Bdellovibrio sp.]|nr:thioredoxin family protein [Bdellovibrio sp.]